MRLNYSCIFNENPNVTFTYNHPPQTPSHKNSLFRSSLFTISNDSRAPLAEVTTNVSFHNHSRTDKILAQSFYQDNSQELMLTSFCQNQLSVQNHTETTGLAKLAQLNPRFIPDEIHHTQIEDFQIGELLGKGALGSVYICRHKQTGFFFAVKKIKKKTVSDINQFARSIKIHLFLNQPNIVKLYSVFNDSEHIYLLMELCIDGNLKSKAKKFTASKEIKKFLLGIAYGLRHLHRRNIRHGDIKLENIICSYGMTKISDFDCISFQKVKNPFHKKENCSMPGSPLYFSPQMLRQSILGLNDDVWSLGIICYEILCGYYPFEISSPSQLSNIFLKDIKPFPFGTDFFLEQLTRKMLSKRICERPKLSSIIDQLERD